MSSTITEKLTNYQQRKQELIITSFYNLQDDEADDILLLVDKWVEAAFQRGYQAGKDELQDDEPWDAVLHAQNAQIECSTTLSNLYSKEQGFKQ